MMYYFVLLLHSSVSGDNTLRASLWSSDFQLCNHLLLSSEGLGEERWLRAYPMLYSVLYSICDEQAISTSSGPHAMQGSLAAAFNQKELPSSECSCDAGMAWEDQGPPPAVICTDENISQ